jgi:uncharacterized RDD family membrane protein YckC
VSEHEIDPVPREARRYQGTPAGVVTRVIANTIDALVVGVVLGLGYAGWASALFIIDPLDFRFPSPGILFSLTAGFVVSLVYLWLAWWLTARTYGGQVMGLRVRGRSGKRLGPLRSLARSAFCVFFPVGLFWCVVSPERRSVQDIALWTAVVYDWHPGSAGPGEPAAVTPPGGR